MHFTPSTVFTFNQPLGENMFRKIAQNRIMQKWNSAVLRKMKICEKTKCNESENVCYLSQKLRKSFANGNPSFILLCF